MHPLHYAENHFKGNGWFHRNRAIPFNTLKDKVCNIVLSSHHDGSLHKQMGRVGFHVPVHENIN